MATAAASMAMAGGMWRKPNGGAQEAAVFSSVQPTGQEVRTHSSNNTTSAATENVVCRLNEETANVPNRLPGLSEVPRRGGRSRRRSRSWHEKKTDTEFDIVIVPSDGCYMSGSDSDDSDWSVGWFEPHPPDFSGNEGEESFGVLVPSYSLSASEFSSNSTGQSEHKDSKAPAWAALLANISNHTDAESQKQLDLWLASLTSPC
ncbi:unnamed protein product [Calypogeia fissa]